MRSNPGSNSRVTLTEVARRAGVSITTASLVLTGKAKHNRISEATRHRVRAAAAELDYSPNLLIRSLRRGRTNILAFLSAFRNREAHDIYMDRLLTSIQRAVGSHGMNLLVFCDFGLSDADTYRFINGGHCDGLLFFAPRDSDPLLPMLRTSRLPVVLLNARDDDGVLPSVRDDVNMGMRLVVEELARLGHRRIGAIRERWQEPGDSATRIGLLRQYATEAGLSVREEHILEYCSDTPQQLAEMLQGPASPTAIFCWRDFVAYRVLEIVESLGVSVPEELSVVGYDGIHWPSLTHHIAASVYVDPELLAEAAVHLLQRYIQGHEGSVIEQSIPVSLVQGTTLGPPGRPGPK